MLIILKVAPFRNRRLILPASLITHILTAELVEFSSDGINLRGVLSQSDDSIGTGALILHPHPLYGGNMEDRVVLAMEEVLLNRGYTTLRFNFRGTESTSMGFFGVDGAVNDAKNAARVLLSKNVIRFGIVGYSFGGSVALRYTTETNSDFLITLSASYALVSEVGFDTTLLSEIHCPTLIFHGKADHVIPFTDLELLASLMRNSNVERVLLEGEGHFYLRSLDQVSRRIDEFLLGLT